jgi:adenylylsulfate kinase
MDFRTFVLDGDNVRHGLNSNLDFSETDRSENIRRISEVSKLMLEAGLIVMTAFISPFTEDRNTARNLIQNDNFIEIYCKASIETCEKRDVKGLYKKARAGKIKNYTGIDSPYEAPVNPELIINTDKESLDESISKILSYLQENILKS